MDKVDELRRDTFLKDSKIRIDYFLNKALDLNNCYRIIMQLQEYKNNERDFIEISEAFFEIVYHSLIHKMVIEIPKLFDEKTENENLFNLLMKLKKEIAFLENISFEVSHFTEFNSTETVTVKYTNVSDMIDSNLKIMNSLIDIREPIRIQRNKFYAHSDKKYAINPSDLYSKHPIKFKYFERTLLAYSNICNDICMILNGYTMFPFMLKVDDLSHMLALIHSK